MNTLKCITPTMCYSLEENCTEKQMIKNWGWFKGLLAHPLCSENTQRGSASALEFSCVWSRWQRLVHPRLALRLCPRCTHDGPPRSMRGSPACVWTTHRHRLLQLTQSTNGWARRRRVVLPGGVTFSPLVFLLWQEYEPGSLISLKQCYWFLCLFPLQ